MCNLKYKGESLFKELDGDILNNPCGSMINHHLELLS